MFDITKSVLMQTVFAAKSQGNLNEAKAFLSTAAKYSFNIEQLDEIGYLQSEVKDYHGSVNTCKKMLSNPNLQEQAKFSVRANLAKVFNHLNEPELSLQQSQENAKTQLTYDTLMEASFSHYLLGDYKTSESMMRQLAAQPDLPEAIRNRVLYNLGSYDIEAGHFKQGLRGFIGVGHDIGIWKYSGFEGIMKWEGQIEPGKTILIHAEGGIGDEIIGIRFMQNIEQLGMKPVWLTDRLDIQTILRRHGFESCAPDRSNCFQILAMFLPIVLNLDKSEVWNGPYLTASKDFVEKWKALLPERFMAVKWTGNPHYEQDLHRSVPLELIEGLDFDGEKVNLQLEPENQGKDWLFDVKINNLEDTLAILELSDMVVTSCTSIAHLAGALGKRAVVCPPIACYYTWLGGGGWYGNNLTVVRQTKHRSWSDVFETVQEQVNAI